jgi:hypothetical protein
VLVKSLNYYEHIAEQVEKDGMGTENNVNIDYLPNENNDTKDQTIQKRI